MPGWPVSRRHFLGLLGMGLVGAACGGGSKAARRPPAPGSIDALRRGATELSLFLSAAHDNPVNPGKNRISFALGTEQGGVISGGSPQVYLSPSASARAEGPVPATWYEFTGYEKTGDHSPKSPFPGTYALEVDTPSTGNWQMLVLVQGSGGTGAGVASFPVNEERLPAAVGTRAVSTRTPVATTRAKLERICTRQPPDRMHSISLDAALESGKPTVVVFATPLLCESKLCGPVVDEVSLVFEKVGADRANFIHVEEFLPGPKLSPPPPTLETRSPAFKAWGFESEPWVIVIDKKGIIRGRLGPGPSTAPEIEAALSPLL